jgi:L-ascorbate metabolism protein UlaG (beta-lactamase superfamily)
MKLLFPFTPTLFLTLLSFQSTVILAQKVEIEYLANECVLIKAENSLVIIDGVFKRKFDYLDVLSDEELSKIERAKNPYESIDFILATHFHGDHFNAELVGEHLLNNINCTFLGPSETVNNFKNDFKNYDLISNRVNVETPNLFESQIVRFKNVEITVLRFEHFGNSPWKEAENVAYLISIDGRKILHLGDSKIDAQSLAKFSLEKENIDVAIIPYWMVGSTEQKEIIEKHITPRKILVAHIPLAQYSNAQEQINALGYKNATALVEQFMTLEIE